MKRLAILLLIAACSDPAAPEVPKIVERTGWCVYTDTVETPYAWIEMSGVYHGDICDALIAQYPKNTHWR